MRHRVLDCEVFPSPAPCVNWWVCKESGEAKTILFGLSGTGYFDLVAYQQYNDGAMTDYIPTDEDLEEAIKCVPPQPEE